VHISCIALGFMYVTLSLVFLFCFFVGIFAQFCTMKVLFTDFLKKQTEALKLFESVIFL